MTAVSAQQQARLSSLVGAREGRCLNVMDATAHGLQAQHRNRYASVSLAPMLCKAKPSITFYPSFEAVPKSAY